MRLVPRQLQRSGFPGSVPYYGGRLTPGVITGLATPTPSAPQTAPPPMGAQPLPAGVDRHRPLDVLNELRSFGLLTEQEYLTIRQRIGAV